MHKKVLVPCHYCHNTNSTCNEDSLKYCFMTRSLLWVSRSNISYNTITQMYVRIFHNNYNNLPNQLTCLINLPLSRTMTETEQNVCKMSSTARNCQAMIKIQAIIVSTQASWCAADMIGVTPRLGKRKTGTDQVSNFLRFCATAVCSFPSHKTLLITIKMPFGVPELFHKALK